MTRDGEAVVQIAIAAATAVTIDHVRGDGDVISDGGPTGSSRECRPG